MTQTITIQHPDDYLGLTCALLRIQAIQQEYIRRQVEEYGEDRDAMEKGKAWLEERGERGV